MSLLGEEDLYGVDNGFLAPSSESLEPISFSRPISALFVFALWLLTLSLGLILSIAGLLALGVSLLWSKARSQTCLLLKQIFRVEQNEAAPAQESTFDEISTPVGVLGFSGLLLLSEGFIAATHLLQRLFDRFYPSGGARIRRLRHPAPDLALGEQLRVLFENNPRLQQNKKYRKLACETGSSILLEKLVKDSSENSKSEILRHLIKASPFYALKLLEDPEYQPLMRLLSQEDIKGLSLSESYDIRLRAFDLLGSYKAEPSDSPSAKTESS